MSRGIKIKDINEWCTKQERALKQLEQREIIYSSYSRVNEHRVKCVLDLLRLGQSWFWSLHFKVGGFRPCIF